VPVPMKSQAVLLCFSIVLGGGLMVVSLLHAGESPAATAPLARTAAPLDGPAAFPPASAGGESHPLAPIHTAELSGVIHPLSAGYLIEAIDRADADGAALLIIEMDTPGGLVDSTKDVVQRMLRATTPIVVYVTPAGARAASGGFLLLLAADVAAMAPATNTGAAHPVVAGGENQKEDIGLKKAESDIAAFTRTIAEHRGRNVALAEKAVVESVSFTETEALREKLIDLVAKDRAGLLAALDGRTIRRFDGTETRLATRGPVLEPLARSLPQRILGPLLQPELVLLLLGIGVVALYIELSHPGLILPGVVGVAALLLFALAFRYLPLNAVGLVLVVLGLVLFILEIKVVSYGMLAVGGTGCLVAGLLMLFPRDVPALRVSPALVLPVAGTMVGIMGLIAVMVGRAQASPVVTGAEGMVGEVGRALTNLDPTGQVFVHGETWEARAGSPVGAGESVRVRGVEGLCLLIERTGGPK